MTATTLEDAIIQALHMTMNKERVHLWLDTPNSAKLFSGQTPRQFLLGADKCTKRNVLVHILSRWANKSY